MTWTPSSTPDGVGPRICFQPVPETKVVKNRLHLDIKIADRTAALETCIGCGRCICVASNAKVAKTPAIGEEQNVLRL